MSQSEFNSWQEEIRYIQNMIDLEREWDEEDEEATPTPPLLVV